MVSKSFVLCLNNQVKERIRQEQEEEKQRLEAEMQRLMALEEDHRKKVQQKEQEMGKIKEDLEKKWDLERRQVVWKYFGLLRHNTKLRPREWWRKMMGGGVVGDRLAMTSPLLLF